MATPGNEPLHADRHCEDCGKQVRAERRRSVWGAGTLILVVVTIGFWVPLRMMFRAVGSPWRWSECGHGVEPWYTALARAGAYGFAGLVAVIVGVPMFVGVVSGISERRKAADFEAHRAEIVGEISALSSAGRYSDAVA